jgi:hypothetical protein
MFLCYVVLSYISLHLRFCLSTYSALACNLSLVFYVVFLLNAITSIYNALSAIDLVAVESAQK